MMIEFVTDGTVGEDSAAPEKLGLDRVKAIISLALKKRFPGDAQRQEVISRIGGDRLNFCCPYCGDSLDPRKKRGNLYTDTLTYKCYNGGCEMHVGLLKLVKDFDVMDVMTDGEKSSARETITNFMSESKQTRMQRQDLSLDMMVSTDFPKMLVRRTKLIEKLGLSEILPGTFMHTYLRNRFQTVDKKFLVDTRKNRLYILNLDRSGEMVFALQTRQFGKAVVTGAKYLTYNLTGVWSKLLGCTDVDFINETAKLNAVSTVFGCLRINFNEPITLFEGPLDSFLYPNSCGMCSINNEWPFAVEGYRWFQDNDDAGRKRALREIAAGKQVFMWSKFMDDYSIRGQKIKDLNDLVIYESEHKMTFGDLSRFFSSHKLDGIFI